MDDEVAEADALDSAYLEVVDPCPQGGVEALGVALGGQAAVAQPHGGVLDRVLDLALDDPAVEPLGDPGGDGLAPRVSTTVLPVAEQWTMSATPATEGLFGQKTITGASGSAAVGKVYTAGGTYTLPGSR